MSHPTSNTGQMGGARAQASQPLKPPHRSNQMRQGGNTASSWEQEWRSDVVGQLGEIAKKQESAALILERLTNRFDEHDRRITALEGQPARQQATFLGVGNLGMSVVYGLISLAALAISLGSHLSFH